ncbi:MAG: hypothetical protein A2X86_22025 [Bdellovibrionales bacterium GWA2_49_15]|nr:MAG: hypothetical protein A2X86_22025 [Bdellovibrionales bacterium GWA2_49_15]
MHRGRTIIVDIDGTLADIEHRVPHLTGEKKNWHEFNKNFDKDILNKWCAEIITAMQAQGVGVILLTGRGERYRAPTAEWLLAHGVKYDQLFMRKSKDRREDALIKKEIYLEHIQPSNEVLFVVEDRLNVVKMWRELGLVCLQCDWGDF